VLGKVGKVGLLSSVSETVKADCRIDFQYKPELDNTPPPRAGSSSSGTRITSQLAMTLDEAHLILDVKKEDSLEAIQRVCFSVSSHLTSDMDEFICGERC